MAHTLTHTLGNSLLSAADARRQFSLVLENAAIKGVTDVQHHGAIKASVVSPEIGILAKKEAKLGLCEKDRVRKAINKLNKLVELQPGGQVDVLKLFEFILDDLSNSDLAQPK